MSGCGARITRRSQAHSCSSTAVPPYSSLDLPQAALGNVAASITLRLKLCVGGKRLVLSGCGARITRRSQAHLCSSTAVPPYSSLDLPQAALGNVAASITLRIKLCVWGGSASLCPVAVPELHVVRKLTRVLRPLSLLIPRLICRRQCSETSPLR